MNLLLVNTNRMKPAVAPIGLDYLADVLEAAGHRIELLDLCFAEDVAGEIKRCLSRFTPEAIGVTIRNTDDCYFSGQSFFLPEIRRMVSRLREGSDAPIILGGVGFSVAPVAVFEYCQADFAIAGEAELALGELLRALMGQLDLGQVPNLIYRAQGQPRRNPARPVDLAGLPPRRRGLVDNARYFRAGGQAGFETKRGCPMQCVYCADPVANGRTTRLRPPDQVAAELATLRAQGIDHFHTCDCEFNLPRPHALAVCQAIIDAGLGEQIRWYAYCAPTPFDSELAGVFKRAGCAGIDFGADSGTNEMLRRLGRHFTTADLARTANICRQHGIPFMYDLLLGGPGETPDSIRQTIDFIRRVNPDCVGLSLGVRLYAGTAISQQVSRAGDLADQPHLFGAKDGQPPLLKPVFYVSPALGNELTTRVRELVAGDRRFFLPDESPANANYNYNDNTDLVQAIAAGARGAYWDILRRTRQ